MQRQIGPLAAIALTCVLAAPVVSSAAQAATFATATARLQAQAAGFSSYVLPNGFKIILAPFPSAPDVRVELVVKAGSLVEGYGETGAAHLLEHMLFKGAGSRASVKNDLSKLGARWNATTSADRTNFFETLRADPEALDEAIRIEADRFIRPAFTREDLASEMTVVRNELERNDADPGSVLMRAVQRQSFFWHGYGRPTIGARSDIENATVEALMAFHARHYRPDNAFLIVSGNFDAARVLALAAQVFSEARNPVTPRVASWTREEPRAMTRRSEVFLPAGRTMAVSAWVIPGSHDRQTIAFGLATTAICSGDWGSLRKDIVLERKAAVSAGCFEWEQREAGLFVATASAAQDSDAAALSRALLEHIEAAAAKGITQEQLERAKQEQLNAYERAGNSHEQFAALLSNAETSGDWRLVFWQRDAVKAVTVEEANFALRRWLVSANRSDALLRHAQTLAAPELPTPDDPQERVEGKEWPSVVTTSDPLPQTAAQLAQATIHLPLGGGRAQAALISRKTQGDRAWIVLANDFGNEAALRGRGTACNMASALFRFGGAGYTRSELDSAMGKLQANWDVSMGRIAIEAPRRNVDAALDLLLKVWASPTIPRDEFERLKAGAIAGGEAALQDPAAVASNALELRFDNYPENHPKKPRSIEQELALLRAMTFDEVRACQAEFAGLSHVRLVLVGDFLVSDVEAVWTKIAKLPVATVPYERIRDLDAPATVDTTQITVSRPSKPDATVAGRAAIDITDGAEDFAALRIAVKILGADAQSRVWNRLRETEGLAYSAGAILAGSTFEARTEFALSASASSENAETALASLQDELARALRDGFTEAEVEQAKKTWFQERTRYASDERLFAARLSQGLLTRRDFAWIAQYDARIAKVTAEEVTNAFRKHVGSAPIVWMIGKGSQS